MNNSQASVDQQASALGELAARLDRVEAQNRFMKRITLVMAALLFAAAGFGFQTASRVIRADKVVSGTVTAGAFLVTTEKGSIRLDEKGLTIIAPGEKNPVRTNVVEHESRIEIGMDYEWSQDNGLRPTPRIIVGRVGKDAHENDLTRAAILSPQGVHSGEWHTNNPKHDGRTDRDLIDELRRR